MFKNKKIKFILLLSFCSSVIACCQQAIEKDSFSIRKITCDSTLFWEQHYNPKNISRYYCSLLFFVEGLQSSKESFWYMTNDSVRVKQYIAMELSKNYNIFSAKYIAKVEEFLHCEIRDTIDYCEAWIIKPGKDFQIKPLRTDSFWYTVFDNYFGSVHYPDDIGSPVENIIANRGYLGRIAMVLSGFSNQYILIDEAADKNARYTFEISKAIIERGNFEEIKAALKDEIDFDMYREIRPIKKTYIKFLE